ncbi:hypothetical protein F4813DRAFT_287159 [Daldinia decipiens]|uniref:uncharacterized protein n=1 Tax=Daldinia decipiens TaxID=326647 RepID=UPI0020C50CF4|nr:uncharacterized protein F4813DRAFT_287159 [Daldinia decipiens]KAI1652943.1 hypothetical protein F4813DRAFT_287159 [Daldinia decipiens]
MVHLPTDRDELRRRVSISTLPRLTRAGTFEIEIRYFMKHVRHRARKFEKLCKRLASVISGILKYLAFAPYLPCVCFFILADKFGTSTEHESIEETLDEIIYIAHPEYLSDDNFNVVIIETREVEG